MSHRLRRGWLKKEKRAQGETWVLFFRSSRPSDGKRVENKSLIGLVRHLPDASSACRGRTTPCSYQPSRCATRIDLWRLGSALRSTRAGALSYCAQPARKR
jgi:hypothetical protein